MDRLHHWIERRAARRAEAARVTAVLRAHPETSAFEAGPEGWLKWRADKGAVLAGRLDDVPVVVKRFVGPGAPRTVRCLAEEVGYLHAHLPPGPFRVAPVLHALEAEGIAVLARVPGRRLGDDIADASGRARAALLALAGAWLSAMTGLRTEDTPFAPRHWVRAMDRRGVPPDADGTALATALTEGARAMAPALQGLSVRQASTHGDYVGRNVIHDAGTVWGIDIQGECRQAVARDCARFLVCQAIDEPDRGQARRHGLPADDMAAFLSEAPLPEAERSTTLPFLTAEALHARLHDEGMTGDQRARAHVAARAWLAEHAA